MENLCLFKWKIYYFSILNMNLEHKFYILKWKNLQLFVISNFFFQFIKKNTSFLIMFSLQNDDDISPENIDEFNELIKQTERYIIDNIKTNANLHKVVFIGMTGCGKSSLLCSLSGKELLIKGEKNMMHLEGEGVGKSLDSCTTIPVFVPSINEKYLFIDCPGFEDVRGYKQEILNAFSMDNIFENCEGHENKYKIILVASDGEFKVNRGAKLLNSISRLEEMIPIGNMLKKSIGLVITKGDPEYEGIEYIEELNESIITTKNPPHKLIMMCNAFTSNPDHVFSFPRPSRKDKDKQYDFNDHEKLLEFLDKDPLINPKHCISISNEAKLKLKIIREDHSKKLSDTVKNLCDKLYNLFSTESKSDEINKWYDIIIKLMGSNIKKSRDLDLFLQENIHTNENFENYIKEIEQYELFDEFIDKIIYSHIDTSCLNEVLQAWCLHAINELHHSFILAVDSENSKEQIEIQEKLMRDSEEKIKELKEIMDRNELERKKKEQEYLDEIKKQTAAHQENMNQFRNLQNQYIQSQKERDKTIDRLLNELNEERRNKGGGNGRRCNIC